MVRIGRTVWIQPGQEGEKLHGVHVEITDDAAIRHTTHSGFGPIASGRDDPGILFGSPEEEPEQDGRSWTG